ncbi:unnamed protein product [Leptidea sinapis]|uniref:ABC transporter domain-containing protein n=1 Tax=Leptidea sinapis TaxID=189913 RepID=A0A5E4PVW2_9NEOP|nr:unnamed protein product [Leptidea sinapis]
MSGLTNFALKFVTKQQKHDILLYSTLLSKLIEIAEQLININMKIEQVVYDVSLRNPEAVKILLKLPLSIVANGLEGLADPERAQIITSNLEHPEQPFCDLDKVTKFFMVTTKEATEIKILLCSDAWKQYVHDMIVSFGTYDVKKNINSMASLFIMDTLGRDIMDQLYTIDQDMNILKNFTQLLATLDKIEKPNLNWSRIFNENRDAEFLEVINGPRISCKRSSKTKCPASAEDKSDPQKGHRNASMYLTFPRKIDEDSFVWTLCNVSNAIEDGLKADSLFAKADLYMKVSSDYPYVFEFRSYGMDAQTQTKVQEMFEDAKSLKVSLRVLDIMDYEVFDMKSDIWLKIKYALAISAGPMDAVHDLIIFVNDVLKNDLQETELPTKTASALHTVILAMPELLLETSRIIVDDALEVEPLVTILNSDKPWPCYKSLTDILQFGSKTKGSVKTLELLLCFDEPLQEEWKAYVQKKNKTAKWNSTSYEPHVILKFSSAFDGSLESIDALKEISKNINKIENTTMLQIAGFTKDTALYMLYEKMPDFIAVLVRRASQTVFWDCEAVVMALKPAPGSPITSSIIRRIYPLVCPTFFYWIGMPRGDNKFMDIIAKPQYLYFTLNVTDFTSKYNEAYTNVNDLYNLVRNLTNNPIKVDLSIDNLKTRLGTAVNSVLSFKISEKDPSYILFNNIMNKQTISTVYLTRTVVIINKMLELFNTINISEVISNVSEEDAKKIESDLNSIKRMFTRRPTEVIGIHFDVITDVLWTNRNDYKITNGLEVMCDSVVSNDTSKVILGESQRVKSIICSKQYKILYNAVQHVLDDDYEAIRNSLLHSVKILQTNNTEDVANVFSYINERAPLVESLKTSISYAYDLSIPIYLRYLHSTLQHYGIVVEFLAGNDWWTELRSLYSGYYSKQFLNSVESVFEISEDIITNVDKLHIVRLIHDISENNSEILCQTNVSLSDYLPDSRGHLSRLQRQLCSHNTTELFREIPPLLFASQEYETSLKLKPDIDYPDLYLDLANTESKLSSITHGPQTPQLPHWITEAKISKLKALLIGLLSKETLTKISFGMMSNIVDASTLYLNTTYCTYCPEITSWLKQLNLQLYKRPEYDNLLCHLDSMRLEDIHLELNNDFHWDMAIGEIISTRNYTKYELNKSLNEFLELVEQNILEDITATTRITDCLAHNISRNAMGNATLFAKVLSRTITLFRAELPHLQEINGITEVKYFKNLESEVANNLVLDVPLVDCLKDSKQFLDDIANKMHGEILDDIKDSNIDIRLINDSVNDIEVVKLKSNDWQVICILQHEEFWRFNFITNILRPSEAVVESISTILGFLSKMDVENAAKGNLASVINVAMQLLMDDTLNGITYSIDRILSEVKPFLHDTALDVDINSLTQGLRVIHQLKNDIIENDVKIKIADVFVNPEKIKLSMINKGINKTEFWTQTAPELQEGYINLKPLFSRKHGTYQISDFVCKIENISQVFTLSTTENIKAKELYSLVADQFCGMTDEHAKQIIPILIENINFTYILDQVKELLLTKLYKASNLTQEEGVEVFSKLSEMTTFLPKVQDSVANITGTLAQEPLFQRLKSGFSIGGISRFYKTVVSSINLSSQPDKEQLQVLPMHSFAPAFSTIDTISSHKDGLRALTELLSSDQYQEIRKALIGDIAPPSIDVDDLINGLGDTKSLGNLLRKASDFLRCINTDRFHGVSDEETMAREAARLTRVNEFSAGLVFLNMNNNSEKVPANVEYKIRMDIENAPTTKHTKNYDNRKHKRDTAVTEDANWSQYTQQNPYHCYINVGDGSEPHLPHSIMVPSHLHRDGGDDGVDFVSPILHQDSSADCAFLDFRIALLFWTLCNNYLVSKLFNSASLGGVCAAMTYLMTFMPFIVILSLEDVLSSSLKTFVSLSMSSSLCYGFLFITRFEAMGVGAGWAQLWEAPDNTSDMNIGIAGLMLLFDAVLYFIVGYFLEIIWVSIINITKVYGRGPPALDNVSMELHPGQVTTLLGHNGAGKSTLINILTGMLKPTSGQVVIRSDSSGVTRAGVCPQRDVLYEHMSAREHVTIILSVLSLGAVSDEAVSRLSGGTRRRLCVALAFVARPALVSLDEPTAGVDPRARSVVFPDTRLSQDNTKELDIEEKTKHLLTVTKSVVKNAGLVDVDGTEVDINIPFYDPDGVNNKWLLFLLIGLPPLFVLIAMGFSKIRPPVNDEISLNPKPSLHSSHIDPYFAANVMEIQQCEMTGQLEHPELMMLPDISTLNEWLISSQQQYIEKRYACAGVVHTTEKLFKEASLANMSTDYIRWLLHKIFLISPQFCLVDGLLEIAKNTIQSQVLQQFAMDTYRDPFNTTLIFYHCVALICVGTLLFLLNLAIEYNMFELMFVRFSGARYEAISGVSSEVKSVAREERRVRAAVAPLRLRTIGNINAVTGVGNSDVISCVGISKAYPTLTGYKLACTALVGQNGAGKSSTFAMLTGECPPSGGQLYVQDTPASPRHLRNALIIGDKEVISKMSDAFRLMQDLQRSCDIVDFTVNQSSLDQMFLSCSGKAEALCLEPDTLETDNHELHAGKYKINYPSLVVLRKPKIYILVLTKNHYIYYFKCNYDY